MIIGVTGFLSSGKDTVAEYLIKKGFHHFSLSDELRKILTRRRIEINRDNLREVANQIRKTQGSDFLAKLIVKKIKQPAIITSIRTIDEVKVFQKLKNFTLIFVDASVKLRFKRLKKRAREHDEKLTYKKFLIQEKAEKGSCPNCQQLGLVRKMANKKIINDKDLRSLYKKINQVILELKNAEKK